MLDAAAMIEGIATDPGGRQFELRRQKCPTCGVFSNKVLGLRGGQYQRQNLGITSIIVQCRICSLVFPDPFPFPRAPRELYGDPDKYRIDPYDRSEIDFDWTIRGG